jgi:hypothetical protein
VSNIGLSSLPQQLELDLWQILAVAQAEPATVGFIELCGHLDGLNLVDLWLGLLLGDTGCMVSRQVNCEIEFGVDFYDRAGIWIVELVT